MSKQRLAFPACRCLVLRFTLLLGILLLPRIAIAAQGTLEAEFTVDTPLAVVVAKLDTVESLRRLLESQGIELLEHELTKRDLNFRQQTIDAEVQISARARRFSASPGGIKQTVRLGLDRTRVEFALVESIGQLAHQYYKIDLTASEKGTLIHVSMFTRVFVPQRRLCMVQRMVNRVAHRRLGEEQCQLMADLRSEIVRLIAEDRPADAKSVVRP